MRKVELPDLHLSSTLSGSPRSHVRSATTSTHVSRKPASVRTSRLPIPSLFPSPVRTAAPKQQGERSEFPNCTYLASARETTIRKPAALGAIIRGCSDVSSALPVSAGLLLCDREKGTAIGEDSNSLILRYPFRLTKTTLSVLQRLSASSVAGL